MSDNLVSKVPDKGEDIRYAAAVLGKGAVPTGRIRVVERPDKSTQLQQQWQGSFGQCWLPVPLVVENDSNKPTIL